MAKRLNKNDIIRGRIFDTVANVYGSSVLGFYEGKLRIEIIDDETGEVIQFSIAPTIHKTLVDEAECDPYLDTDARIAEYQATLKKNEDKKTKTKIKGKKKDTTELAIDKDTKCEKENQKTISEDEQNKLDALMAELGI